jgi:hypothetical protein
MCSINHNGLNTLENIHLEMSPELREKFFKWYVDQFNDPESLLNTTLKSTGYPIILAHDMPHNSYTRIDAMAQPHHWIGIVTKISMSDFPGGNAYDQCSFYPVHTWYSDCFYTISELDNYVLKPCLVVENNREIVNLLCFIIVQKTEIKCNNE